LLDQRDGEARTGELWRKIDVHAFCKMETLPSKKKKDGDTEKP
jgi:hypothetical protein